jgi:hypothetical protein
MSFIPVRRKELRRKFQKELLALEQKYTEDKLRDIVSRQNQSPNNSTIYWANLNWLTREEFLALSLVAWLTDSKTIKSLILEELVPRMEKQQGLDGMEKWNLMRFLSDHVKRGLPFYRSHQKVFFSYIPKRQLLGILGDSRTWRLLNRRLRPKVWFPPRPSRTQRRRGYSDLVLTALTTEGKHAGSRQLARNPQQSNN